MDVAKKIALLAHHNLFHLRLFCGLVKHWNTNENKGAVWKKIKKRNKIDRYRYKPLKLTRAW